MADGLDAALARMKEAFERRLDKVVCLHRFRAAIPDAMDLTAAVASQMPLRSTVSAEVDRPLVGTPDRNPASGKTETLVGRVVRLFGWRNR